MTGTCSSTASRRRDATGAIHGNASFTLIGPPMSPIPANGRGSAGIGSPRSIRTSWNPTPFASSHSAKCAGPSVGEKRKMATGRIDIGCTQHSGNQRGTSTFTIVHITSAAPIASAMNPVRFAVTVVSMLVVAAASRGAEVVVPNANLNAENIPPIPAALAAKVAPYTEFKPTTAVSWHPKERELIVARRAGNVTQLHRVAKPGDEPRQLTDFAEPVRFGLYWPKAPDTLVYSRDTGGDEQQQLYRLDANGATPALLTDATRKNTSAGLTHARDFLLLESTDVDKAGKRENPTLELSLLDPLDPPKSRRVATLPGTGWGDYTFSFDDKRIAMIEYISVNESY